MALRFVWACALAAAAALAQGQRIERFEVRNNRLFLHIDGQDRIVSTTAVGAWPGWLPSQVIYTERVDGRERIRWYDAFTRNSQTIGFEDLHVADVTTVRLSGGRYAILLALRDASNMPSVALATPEGIFHRERNAMYGTAANDAVEILRYDPEDLMRTRGDLTLLKPAVSVSVPLKPPPARAEGIYEAILPAASTGASRTVTLNLRPDSSATLVMVFEGREPVVRRGKWSQREAEVRLDLEGPGAESLTWTLTADGLTPRTWDKSSWGATGLTLRRAEASNPVPRRAPGTVR